jgi:hypothetical protein
MLMFGVSLTPACNFAALTGRSSNRILTLVKEYELCGKLAPPSEERRGPKSNPELSGEQQERILARMMRWADEGGVAVTMRLIQLSTEHMGA